MKRLVFVLFLFLIGCSEKESMNLMVSFEVGGRSDKDFTSVSALIFRNTTGFPIESARIYLNNDLTPFLILDRIAAYDSVRWDYKSYKPRITIADRLKIRWKEYFFLSHYNRYYLISGIESLSCFIYPEKDVSVPYVVFSPDNRVMLIPLINTSLDTLPSIILYWQSYPYRSLENIEPRGIRKIFVKDFMTKKDTLKIDWDNGYKQNTKTLVLCRYNGGNFSGIYP